MGKVKINIDYKIGNYRDGYTRKRTSAMIDEFLYKIVVFQLRRKAIYGVNKATSRAGKKFKNNFYKENIMAKSDHQLITNYINSKINSAISDPKNNGLKFTEIVNKILIKLIMNTKLKIEMKIYN